MKTSSICLALSFLLFFPFYSYAQINVSRSVEIEPELEVIPYDSTQNFLGENPYGYVGQQLYLLGNEDERPYRGFILDYNKSESDFDNTYKPHGSSYYNLSSGSSYEDLMGKYFDVLDVIPHPRQSESSLYENNFYLKLLELESADTVYFSYSGNYQSSFPFIVVGYFEKKQTQIIGNKYVLSSRFYTKDEARFSAIQVMRTDRGTGRELTFNTGEVWEVLELIIDEDDDFRLSYLLKNERGNTIAIPEFVIEGAPQIYTLEQANSIKNEIGENVFNQILTRDVQIGWHKTLVQLALGPPRSINRTTTGNLVYEQHVYGDDRYLYFEDDILTSFQGNWMFGVPYLCYECLD